MESYLHQLMSRNDQLVSSLKEGIKGQDQAIDAFAKGIFASELFAGVDEQKKQPQAIFLFAGPPGVGKTLMAELAGDALELPFMRFDMSAYADYQAHMGLIGYDRSYQSAKRGTLTGFVNENPRCILLFDEIEKAHINTIHLFLQILDAGRLRDRFLNKVISFKEAIIIFTTNSGKDLYNDPDIDAGAVTRKMVLDAVERDINPQTGYPFFPPSITSRFATGWPILFGSLRREDLENIIHMELERMAKLFEEVYGITVEISEDLPSAIFEQEGVFDARILRAQAELYFKTRIYQIWHNSSVQQAYTESGHIIL